MADDMGEKTEEPTSRKLEDSRNKGQVPKSLDLSAPLDMLGASVLIWFMGPLLVAASAEVMRRLLAPPGIGAVLSAEDAVRSFVWAMIRLGVIALPIMLLMAMIAIVAQLQQVKFLFTLEPLRPKPEKLNPVTGTAKLFSTRNLVKTIVNVLKIIVVSVVVWMAVSSSAEEIAALPVLGVVEAFRTMTLVVMKVVFWTVAVLLVIGLADWWYQKWQHNRDLRMTRHEVKEDRKNSDGDPEMKARRQRIARDIAMQRAKSAVPKADVVIANPTHFAVALRYDAETMAAPVVVAKGEDFMAFRIREIAAAHGVPIVERPPLARALYATAKVGQTVKPEFFEAVAEVLAYVYRMEKRMAS